MKLKNTFLFVVLISLLFCLPACVKKGEDDPLISFKTRKARLTGDWHITSGTEEQISSYPDSIGVIQESKSTSIYTNNNYQTTTIESQGFQSSSSGAFSYTMSFKKDGGFSSNKIVENFTSNVLEGSWNFTKGIGEHKNKEQIVINLNSNITTYSDPQNSFKYGNTFEGNRTDITYTLKELRNKKLVLVYESTYNTSNGYNSSIKLNLTFEQ